MFFPSTRLTGTCIPTRFVRRGKRDRTRSRSARSAAFEHALPSQSHPIASARNFCFGVRCAGSVAQASLTASFAS